jgi:ATP-dependent Clp protease adapter protein ClpS
MNEKQRYKVMKSVHLDGYGTVEPGKPETVELHPRQAVFLVTGGVLQLHRPARKKTAKKEAKR